MNAPVRIRDEDAVPWRPKLVLRKRPQHNFHVAHWKMHIARMRLAEKARDRKKQADMHVRAWRIYAAASRADIQKWPLSIRPALIETCTTFQVPVEEVLGPSRKAKIAQARQTAMHRIKQETGRSLPWIGRLFDRDHTTVLHAIRKIEAERSRT